MNVLHVNNDDLPGRRFNGFDLLDDMRTRGFASRQAVITKLSNDSRVIDLCRERDDRVLQNALCQAEVRRSMDNLLYPWGRALAATPEFAEADVVHYHLLHNRVVSLLDLPFLFSQKPSVWTFHDPWPLTGHCISPMGCEGWREGCEPCPDPHRSFPLRDDCAGRMWNVKRDVYRRLDVDLVVASDFMLDMVRQSPLTAGFNRVHLVPFGIRTDAYLPDSERPASRETLGIPEDDFVLLFRSTHMETKGLVYILRALALHPPEQPVTLLTLDAEGLLSELSANYRVVELGWVEDPYLYARALSACDVFLMPSMAESFGMMALEAMAAGRPVVCFEGTTIPSVTHAPECGLAVPIGDAVALRAAIDELASKPEEAARRGHLGRTIAHSTYGLERYLDALSSLYKGVQSRFHESERL